MSILRRIDCFLLALTLPLFCLTNYLTPCVAECESLAPKMKSWKHLTIHEKSAFCPKFKSLEMTIGASMYQKSWNIQVKVSKG